MLEVIKINMVRRVAKRAQSAEHRMVKGNHRVQPAVQGNMHLWVGMRVVTVIQENTLVLGGKPVRNAPQVITQRQKADQRVLPVAFCTLVLSGSRNQHPVSMVNSLATQLLHAQLGLVITQDLPLVTHSGSQRLFQDSATEFEDVVG